LEQVQSLSAEALSELEKASTTADLKAIEAKYLGKQGLVSGLMRGIGALSNEDKPKFGAAVNQARTELESRLTEKFQALRSAELAVQLEAERIDVTLPAAPTLHGREHILAATVRKIKRVFTSMGFVYYDGPELELFKYNFDELNYPPDHPAMDAQDTFYITDDTLLRTQGTAIQGRVYEAVKPPLRYFTVGRTFRNEAVDRTHGHTFHQIDAFMVDEGISMAHLKGTLRAFAREMFGDDAQVRFRPDFFPFVEPGVDYAISTKKLFGGRWVELGGAGMVHPNILEKHGIDTERYTGFAFGLGVERIPMMAHGIDDLRYFFENDPRFLEQFS
jgi:phenylalanyl-tRNA synthetase alpha chain